MKQSVQPSWVLARRPFRDSSLLVELLTANTGRTSVVVKGAHRKQRGGSSSNLLQPFSPILVGLGGTSELKYLASIESAGVSIALPGELFFSGLYMNELLVKLVPKSDPMPRLFSCYGKSLEQLGAGRDVDMSLRSFEVALFDELGYQIQWHRDDQGQLIKPDSYYLFMPERGFTERAPGTASEAFRGSDLLSIQDWYRANSQLAQSPKQCLKRVLRKAIDYRLDGRVLKVREALAQWRALDQRTGDE